MHSIEHGFRGGTIKCRPDTPISTPATNSPRIVGNWILTISSAMARAATKITKNSAVAIRVSATSTPWLPPTSSKTAGKSIAHLW